MNIKWESVNEAGSVFEKNMLPPASGIPEAAAFLRKVTEVFAQLSVDFYDAIEELPFTYSERQVQSVLLPAVAKVAKVVMVEQPVTRKSKLTQRLGRLDYWVYYEPFVFLMEVKHAWVAANTQTIRTGMQKAWKVAVDQLKLISKSEARSLCIDPDQLLKIALLVAPCYLASNNESKLRSRNASMGGIDKAAEIQGRLITQLKPNPNWSSVWALPEELQTATFEYDGGRYESYPCVSFVAHVKPL